MRIVSLLPSATEILFAVGAGEDVVGVTFECDEPPQARTRRIVSTSALREGMTPTEIDRAVSERLAAGEDLYRLDAGALADLDADLVVTQDLCAVCAVDLSVVDDALAHLGCRAQVLTTDPHTLDEVLESVLAIGRATGRVEAAEQLVETLRGRLDAVAAALAGLTADALTRVALLEWTDPPFTPGHWVPEMVALAGGTPAQGRAGERSERTSWADVAAASPEVLVLAPCGYDVEGSAALGRELLASGALDAPGLAGLPVWAVDANASFARPGPRLVDGVEALAGILHPDRCPAPPPTMARVLR